MPDVSLSIFKESNTHPFLGFDFKNKSVYKLASIVPNTSEQRDLLDTLFLAPHDFEVYYVQQTLNLPKRLLEIDSTSQHYEDIKELKSFAQNGSKLSVNDCYLIINKDEYSSSTVEFLKQTKYEMTEIPPDELLFIKTS